VYSCWGLKAKRPIGEPGNRGAGGDQFTPGRWDTGSDDSITDTLESQSVLQGAFPIPPDRVPQSAAGADELGQALPVPRACCLPDPAVDTDTALLG
jgi:hypothetical protein